MASEADRLEPITQQIHAVLESRLTALLGDIQAVREIANLIQSTDADIARHELLKDQFRARLDSAAGEARDDLRRRIASEDETVSNLNLLRADLTNTLQSLADELQAGNAS